MATKPKTQLVDLEVEEVSIVDHPAIRRKFLIVKREDPMKRQALPAEEARQVIQKKDDDADFSDILGVSDPALTSPPEETPTDPPPASDTPPAQVADATPPAPADPAPVSDSSPAEPIEKAAGETLKAATSALEKLMSLVNAVKKITGEMPIPNQLLGQLRGIVNSLNLLGGRVGAQKSDDPEPEHEASTDEPIEKVQEATLKAITSGMERLMSVVNRLKDMDAAAAVPAAVGTEIKAIAGVLSGVLGRYPYPAAKSDDPDLVDALLAGDDGFDVFKSATGVDTDDPELVIKVGAKMKRTRLSEFRKAVETLSGILKALEGEAAIAKGHDPAVLDAINKLQENFDGFKKDLEKRVEKMETIRPTGSDSDPEPVNKDEDHFWAGIF